MASLGLAQLGERALVQLAVHQAERVGQLGAAIAGRPRRLQLAQRLVVALEREVAAAERLVAGPGGERAERAHALLQPLHARADRVHLPARVVQRQRARRSATMARDPLHLLAELLRQPRLLGARRAAPGRPGAPATTALTSAAAASTAQRRAQPAPARRARIGAQRREQRLHRREAIGRPTRQAAQEHLPQPARHRRLRAGAAAMPAQHVVASSSTFAVEGERAVERPVERDAEAELIGPLVDRVAEVLLGRHEARRADDRAGVRQRGRRGAAE